MNMQQNASSTVQLLIQTGARVLLEGADKLTDLNDKVVAEGTAEKVKEVEDAIIDGSLHIFDTSTFTVNGKELTDADSEYISDGYFHESEKASAPAFAFIIDGITAVTQ